MKSNAAAVSTTTTSAVNLALSALMVVLFAVATGLAAQIKIPVPGTTVPMTLQTAVVLLSGFWLGSRKGALSQAVYIGLGAIGLPMFAGGPETVGYLVGFVIAAWLVGFLHTNLAGRKNSFMRAWMIAFAASTAIFIPGVIQLKAFMVVGWHQAILMGVVPFIIGDLLKTTFVAAAQAVRR